MTKSQISKIDHNIRFFLNHENQYNPDVVKADTKEGFTELAIEFINDLFPGVSDNEAEQAAQVIASFYFD